MTPGAAMRGDRPTLHCQHCGAGLGDYQLQPECIRRCLRSSRIGLGIGIVRIDEEAYHRTSTVETIA